MGEAGGGLHEGGGDAPQQPHVFLQDAARSLWAEERPGGEEQYSTGREQETAEQEIRGRSPSHLEYLEPGGGRRP